VAAATGFAAATTAAPARAQEPPPGAPDVAPPNSSDADAAAPKKHGKNHTHTAAPALNTDAEARDEANAPAGRHKPATTDAGTKARFGRVEVFGRVAMRAELERHEAIVADADDPRTTESIDSLDLVVPLARLGVRYRAPVKWLSAEIEVDVADGFELLDAWALAKNENLSARAGQFKAPFSAIEMESSFTLPMVRRGIVHDVLVDELEVAGRRPGVAFGVRSRGAFRPSLVLGAFQGSSLTHEDPEDRDVEPLSETALDSQSLVARAEARVWDVTLGVNYEHRVGTDLENDPSHYWTFGADAVLDTELENHGIRVWAEVMDGGSWFEHHLKPVDQYDAIFVSARMIAAFRFGGTRKETFYVEPYAMFATLDPDMDVASDVLVEESIGVNVGLWKRARLGLEAEYQKAQPNFPERYLLGEDADRKALVLGAQVAF
jgi:hypothetical protein